MRTAVLALLISCLFPGCSRAHTPIIIEITTDTTGTRYVVNKQLKSLAEVESYLKQFMDDYAKDGVLGDGIFLRPDSRTSFVTVFDLIVRLQNAGVKRCEVIGSDTSTAAVSEGRSLLITPEVLQHQRYEIP